MICEIINVGTELLLGNILNTNAKFLSEEISRLGVDICYQSIVGDNEERLSELILSSIKRSDILILTGGLGPTEDDITKETVAKVLNIPLVLDEKAYLNIIEYFKKRNMAPSNKKQAMVPENSIVLYNKNGTAPGIIIQKNNKHIIILPGPPSELIPMFNEYIIPYIQNFTNEIIRSRFVKVFGLGESLTEHLIKDLIDNQTNPTIAPYAKATETHLRITAKSSSAKEADTMIDSVTEKIKEKLGVNIIGYDNETLEENLVKELKDKKITIAFAESCTCGAVAAKIGGISGASGILKESYVTYSNDVKERILGVKNNTISKYTEYSKEVAKEMAEGLFEISKADVCVSVTGIAGPGGGTIEKPVGTVYIGVHYDKKNYVKELYLKGDRNKIREYAACHTLNYVRLILKGEEK